MEQPLRRFPIVNLQCRNMCNFISPAWVWINTLTLALKCCWFKIGINASGILYLFRLKNATFEIDLTGVWNLGGAGGSASWRFCGTRRPDSGRDRFFRAFWNKSIRRCVANFSWPWRDVFHFAGAKVKINFQKPAVIFREATNAEEVPLVKNKYSFLLVFFLLFNFFNL